MRFAGVKGGGTGEQGPGLAVHWPLLLSSCALASAATCAAYLCFSCHVSVSARSRGARARQPRSGDDAAPAACASSRARRRGRPGGATPVRGTRGPSARAGHRRCCAPPPRVTRPRRDPFSVTTTRARGFLPDCADSRYRDTRKRPRPRPRASTTTARAPRREIVSPSTTAPQRTGRGTRRHRTIIDSPSRS